MRPHHLRILILILTASIFPFLRSIFGKDGIFAPHLIENEFSLFKISDLDRVKNIPANDTFRMDKTYKIGIKKVNEALMESSYKQSQPRARTSRHICQLQNKSILLPTVPYFAIIGAQKAGTTSLTRYLTEHPDIMPPLNPRRKEIHFFDNVFRALKNNQVMFNRQLGINTEFWCLARKRYAETMYQIDPLLELINQNDKDASTHFLSFDKTPSYIHLDNCPEYLKKTCPWMTKIIVIIRNPVDRAYSQHQMDIKKKEKRTFEQRIREEIDKAKRVGLHDFPDMPDSIKAIEKIQIPKLNRTAEQEVEAFRQLIGYPMLKKGLYALQLRKWMEYFNFPQEFLVLKYEDLQKNPASVYSRTLDFIGLKPHQLNKYEKHLAGRYDPMPEHCRLYLEKFFQAYNDQLADLLGEEWRNIWS